MALSAARWMLAALAAYLAPGIVFAVAFAARGAARIDPSARGASWGFRLVILPGAVALWPILLVRWLGDGEVEE